MDYGSHRSDSLVCTKYSYITIGSFFITWNSISDLLWNGIIITYPEYCSGDFPLKKFMY